MTKKIAGPGLLQLHVETVRPRERKRLPEVTQQLCAQARSRHCPGQKGQWWEKSPILLPQQTLQGDEGESRVLVLFQTLRCLSCPIPGTPWFTLAPVCQGSPAPLSVHSAVGVGMSPTWQVGWLRLREGSGLSIVTQLLQSRVRIDGPQPHPERDVGSSSYKPLSQAGTLS